MPDLRQKQPGVSHSEWSSVGARFISPGSSSEFFSLKMVQCSGRRSAVSSMGVDPQRYLADLLTRLVNGWPAGAYRRSHALVFGRNTLGLNAKSEP